MRSTTRFKIRWTSNSSSSNRIRTNRTLIWHSANGCERMASSCTLVIWSTSVIWWIVKRIRPIICTTISTKFIRTNSTGNADTYMRTIVKRWTRKSSVWYDSRVRTYTTFHWSARRSVIIWSKKWSISANGRTVAIRTPDCRADTRTYLHAIFIWIRSATNSIGFTFYDSTSLQFRRKYSLATITM